MKSIHSYLTFNGNCREAMTFYKKCLGGELSFQIIGESPLLDKMPVKMKNCVLHSELRNESLVLMGSDMVSDEGLLRGNNVSLLLNCNSENEIAKIYKALSRGGKRTHQLQPTFWGAIFGGLTDKYGNIWMLSYSKKQGNKTG